MQNRGSTFRIHKRLRAPLIVDREWPRAEARTLLDVILPLHLCTCLRHLAMLTSFIFNQTLFSMSASRTTQPRTRELVRLSH